MTAYQLSAGVAAAVMLFAVATACAEVSTDSVSLPSTQHVLVVGQVVQDGKPAPGAEVTVGLWPADESDLKVGQRVETFPADEITTDSNGRYAAALDPAIVPNRYFVSGNIVNLEITASRNSRVATWSASAHLVRGAWTADDAEFNPPTVRLDLSGRSSLSGQE
jgi:hypothetical protein